jgi:hypothetical protein
MRTICPSLLLAVLVACGAPTVTPAPAINPTVRAQLTATRQRDAELGEDACRALDAEFARFGATFQRGQEPQATLLEFARVSGLDPNGHTSASDLYAQRILSLARSCRDA